MKQKKTQLPVVNPHAAGIDVGSRKHFVAVGQQPEDVASFGCYTTDLLQLSQWLKSKMINTIALESTGSYWKGIFRQLQNDGFEVLLVNGKHTRNVNTEKLTTPPYWIDMPKLFELYAYKFLKSKFQKSHEVAYHYSTYGNELEFLVNAEDVKIVVDAKYKPLYIYGKDHQDMRQVSGYSRLEVVYNKLMVEDNSLIDCLIIYPDTISGCDEKQFLTQSLFADPIKGYRNIYKIGIKLPLKI